MGRKLNFYFMIYGSNSRSMEGRTRRGYRAQEAQQRQKKGSRVDARKKELPSLQDSSTAINLRIVYPQIIFVVGVSEEINDSKVSPPLNLGAQEARELEQVRRSRRYPGPGKRGPGPPQVHGEVQGALPGGSGLPRYQPAEAGRQPLEGLLLKKQVLSALRPGRQLPQVQLPLHT